MTAFDLTLNSLNEMPRLAACSEPMLITEVLEGQVSYEGPELHVKEASMGSKGAMRGILRVLDEILSAVESTWLVSLDSNLRTKCHTLRKPTPIL
jgi:hypothetical protein